MDKKGKINLNDILLDKNLQKNVYEKAINKKISNNLLLDKELKKVNMNKKEVTNTDLITSMSTKLTQLLHINQQYKVEIKKYAQENESLKTENSYWKNKLEENNTEGSDLNLDINNFINYKSLYLNLKEYLEKYGLKVKEDQILGNLNIDQLNNDLNKINDEKLKYNKNYPKYVDIKNIAMRIEELNYIILKEAESKKISKNKNIAKLEDFEAPKLKIYFYSNGLFLENYKFFQYGIKDSVNLILDILDGYFPSILEKKYPNGLLLECIDNLNELYTNQHEIKKNDFLNQFDDKVIHNGKILNLRESISKYFIEKSSTPNDINLNNNIFKIDKETGAIRILTDYDENDDSTIKIKIKDNDNNLFLICLSNDCWISLLYKYFDKIYNNKNNFNIFTVYPYKIIERTNKKSFKELNINYQIKLLIKHNN